jgi:hypothetical protein
MKHPDEFLERIRQNEIKQSDWLSKVFTSVNIRTTPSIGGHLKVKRPIATKTFKPGNIFRIFVLTLLLLFLSLLIKEHVVGNRASTSELLPAYLFITILLFSAIRQFFFQKARNFKIHLGINGISIDGRLIEWSNIYETAIITKGSGKSETHYLILALSDMTFYEIFELSAFIKLSLWDFPEILSKYIEYFKARAKTEKRPQLPS